MKKLLSQKHPFFYLLSVSEKRFRRRLSWYLDSKKYTRSKQDERLAYRIKKHQSKLIKKLGETDMRLQYNKVENLKIAIAKINGTLIKPGQTFSFYKTVGKPTKRKGYKLGMEISFGIARAGIGGGICQITNLLHWLSLHTPLTIIERHHHSTDPFPDEGRVLPWASGAAVFYNYLDFQITNNTSGTFQINLWLSEYLLEGEIRSNVDSEHAFHVYEENHKLIKTHNGYFRSNEIWRKKIAKYEGGKVLECELISKNFGKVMYVPENYIIM